MRNKLIIKKNEYLKRDTTMYYHQLYRGYKKPGNPDFLNILKNTFNEEQYENLLVASFNVISILLDDLPDIIAEINLSNCMVVCVPRSKALNSYFDYQLMFYKAVKFTVSNISEITDGADCIVRHTDTLTTHLGKATMMGKIKDNFGNRPYPGITKDTCKINKNRIVNQNIILIDDIYTKTVNIDEDCIQALLDNGAKNVIFYSIGYTCR